MGCTFGKKVSTDPVRDVTFGNEISLKNDIYNKNDKNYKSKVVLSGSLSRGMYVNKHMVNDNVCEKKYK